MKIVSLQAENIKRLTAVEIRPDGALVQVTGENGQGKTSVLDAIWWALAGLGNVQSEPIRKGEDQARIRLDLGELVVTRTFKRKEDGDITHDLRVESAEGAKFPSPQTMLDGLLGAIAFDPLAFSRMAAKDQFDYLKGFVTGFDFDKADQDNAVDYATRTSVNKQAKEKRAVEAQITDAPAEAPLVPDVKSLTDRLAGAAAKNQAIDAERKARADRNQREVLDVESAGVALYNDAKDKHEIAKAALAAAEKALKEAEAANLKAHDEAKAAEEKIAALAPLDPAEDVAAIKAELDAATPLQEKLEKWKKRKAAREEAEQLEKRSAELTAAMEKRTADKVAAVAAAKLPVDGLALGDGMVLLRGLPFDQASDAEKLMTSVTMAMASNPRLKVIRIRDGSLLDTKAMELLAKVAEEKGYQVWVERVDGSGKVGFVIEDGRLKEATKN